MDRFRSTLFANDDAYRSAFTAYADAGAWVRVETTDVPYPLLVRIGIADDGNLICTGLVLGEPDGSARVTASSLRALPISDYLNHVLRSNGKGGAEALFYESVIELAQHAGDDPVPTARASHGYDDAHYENVLQQFRKAQQARPEAPYQYMKDQRLVFGSYSSIRRWVQRALELEADGRIGRQRSRTRKGGQR